MNKVTLIKLGGGLIAPKNWPTETADLSTVKRLVSEIINSKIKVVVAVGSGNFAHNAVKKYGIADEDSVKKVREIAIKPGKLVAEEFGLQGEKVELIEPNEIYTVKNGTLEKDGSEEIEKVLSDGKIPVVYGDVIDDEENGWTIFSGERNLEIIIPTLQRKGWIVEKVVQVSREDGVWNKERQIIPEINSSNWEEVKKEITTTPEVDVTGGMMHKIEKSLEIAKNYKVKTWIVSGKVAGRVEKLLKEEEVVGTEII